MTDTVYIIEDDREICALIRDYLELEGYRVVCIHSGGEALQKLCGDAPCDADCIILDVMLPEVDGFTILDRLGEARTVPVLILSARGDEMYKLKGLGLGADDYIAKPFSALELVARVKNQIRRYKQFACGGEGTRGIITTRGLSVDPAARRVLVDGNEVSLKQKEFDLLLFLCRNPNIVFDKERLYERVWGYDALSDVSTVTVHIARIREKIEREPSRPGYIETVWGAGYRFRA